MTLVEAIKAAGKGGCVRREYHATRDFRWFTVRELDDVRLSLRDAISDDWEAKPKRRELFVHWDADRPRLHTCCVRESCDKPIRFVEAEP